MGYHSSMLKKFPFLLFSFCKHSKIFFSSDFQNYFKVKTETLNSITLLGLYWSSLVN